MACYGYARVSSIDQDYALQEKALRAAGCEIVRAEKALGTKRNGRSELELLLEFLHDGDTLMVTRVDRLARSIKDLQDQVIIDSDVAGLYGLDTKRVNEAVNRNPNKFPEGYLIQLTSSEWDEVKSQIATSPTPFKIKRTIKKRKS